MQNFILGLRVVDNISRPLKIYCDNFVVVSSKRNDKYYKGAKHMELKYLCAKEEVHKQTMLIQQIRNNYTVVDPLTKGLALKVFNEHVEK